MEDVRKYMASSYRRRKKERALREASKIMIGIGFLMIFCSALVAEMESLVPFYVASGTSITFLSIGAYLSGKYKGGNHDGSKGLYR